MMRKIRVIGLMLGVCFLVSGSAFASSPFSAGDWRYEAIDDLGRGRNISGFVVPAEPNRTQGALLVARLLQHFSGEDHLQSRRFGVSTDVYLDDMIFRYNQTVVAEEALTAGQVESLYRLVLEFRDELEVLGYAIQDFNLLYAQSWAEEQGGLYASRPLLFSEQALSAARKRAEERPESVVIDTEPTVETSITEILPSPIEPRNLWTGQFSTTTPFLPPSSSFLAQDPLPQQRSALQLGTFDVDAGLRAPMDGSSAEAAGYGLSVRMGDVSLNTSVDVDVDEESTEPKASASVGLSWDWSDLFTLSADYRQYDREAEAISPSVASLGVTVPISKGQLHLGMSQERNFSDQEGLSDGGDELPKSANIAELGLSYDFKNDSSLRLNYKFIDFSGVEHDPDAEAKAEFSIKF